MSATYQQQTPLETTRSIAAELFEIEQRRFSEFEPLIHGALHSSHSKAMILRLFKGQLTSDFGGPKSKFMYLEKILNRDFGGWDAFRKAYQSLANFEEAKCIAFGLSYVDFRFHLFSLDLKDQNIPFAVSVVAAFPAFSNFLRAHNVERSDFLNDVFRSTDWKVVDDRIGCLTEPLEVI